MGLLDKIAKKAPDMDTLKNRINAIKESLPTKSEEKPVQAQKEEIPAGHVKCPDCGNIIDRKDLGNMRICPKCARLFRLNSRDRIRLIADEGTFEEFDVNMQAKDPLSFPEYPEKIKATQAKSGNKDAVRTGVCSIGGIKTVLAVMDSSFMMGSMGSVVGEKITRAFEYATEHRLPIIVFTCSGGARMQEGIVSLMQMAKISAACARHSDEGLLYITVLTDPTTGGVTASFAMLGDIILSEPKALIGFAGRRVIEGTIKQKLPDDFQTAEFSLAHGFCDAIVEREKLPGVLKQLLMLHSGKKGVESVG